MGILGIANTMAMSVFERTREIGILRAIGWKSWRVMLLIQLEAIVLGIGGGILGIGFGWGALHLLSKFPQTASVVSGMIDPITPPGSPGHRRSLRPRRRRGPGLARRPPLPGGGSSP